MTLRRRRLRQPFLQVVGRDAGSRLLALRLKEIRPLRLRHRPLALGVPAGLQVVQGELILAIR